MKKIMKRILMILLSVIVVVAFAVVVLFHGEFSTLLNMKKLTDYPFYEVSMRADYGLDKYQEKGAATDDELASFISNYMLKGLPVMKAHPNGACATFCAKTPENDVLMARNFDYYPSTVLLVHCNPKHAYHSISMVNLGHIGYNEKKKPEGSMKNKIQILAAPYIPMDGMNEKGLAVGILVVQRPVVHQNTGKVPVTTTAAVRLILDHAATVEEAIELLENVDMNSSGEVGYHFHITDATGDSAVVEYIHNEMKVVRSQNENGVLAATNFTLSTSYYRGSGRDRYKIITDQLDRSNGTLTEEESMKLLEDACVKREDESSKSNKRKSSTQWSVVYNLTERTMKLCIGMDYNKVYEYKVE